MMIHVFGDRVQCAPVGAFSPNQVYAFAVAPQLLDFGSGLVDCLGAGVAGFSKAKPSPCLGTGP